MSVALLSPLSEAKGLGQGVISLVGRPYFTSERSPPQILHLPAQNDIFPPGVLLELRLVVSVASGSPEIPPQQRSFSIFNVWTERL